MTDRPLTAVTLDIRHWGSSLGIRLPTAIAHTAKLKANQRVRVTVEHGKVIIQPINNTRMSLAERLAAYDMHRHSSEAMIAIPTRHKKAPPLSQRGS